MTSLSPEHHYQVTQWLVEEAAMLDSGRFDDWLALMADDVVYRVPVRLTKPRGESDISDKMFHFDETIETLRLRVKRLDTEFAWAEDPPSRTRHFVSNVRVTPGAAEGELAVDSYLLVYRNRGERPDYDLISGQRHDVLRRRNGSWALARRTVVLDQATIGTKNLGIFL